MGSYRIFWKESVHREIRLFPANVISRILQKVEALAINPMPAGYKKLKDAEHTYRLRVGEYRIIYQINSSKRKSLFVESGIVKMFINNV